jgi:NitT/TauT family transport system permease protein
MTGTADTASDSVAPARSQIERASRIVMPALGVALLLGLWFVVHPLTRFLPSPQDVWTEGVALVAEPATYQNILRSLQRLFIGLSAGYLLAFFVSLAGRRSDWWRRFFSVPVYVTITTPSLAFALFCLTVFGLTDLSVYISVAAVIFPFVVVSLHEGFESLDTRLDDMSRVYRLSTGQRLRHVSIPEMAPFLFAALRNAYALGWKIVVVTEVFSAQQVGIGAEYNRAYDFFALETLVVWVVFFLIVVFGVEFGIFRPWEHRVFRWRDARSGRT